MSQLSIGELKAQLLKRGVDISTCLERQDLEAKLKETNDDKTGDVVVDRCDVCDGEDGELLLCDGGMLQGKVQCNYAAHPACVGVDLKDLAEEEDWLCVRCVAAKKKRLKGGHEVTPKKSPKKPPADGKRPRKAPVAEEEEEEEDHVEEEDESDDTTRTHSPKRKRRRPKRPHPSPNSPQKKRSPRKPNRLPLDRHKAQRERQLPRIVRRSSIGKWSRSACLPLSRAATSRSSRRDRFAKLSVPNSESTSPSTRKSSRS